MSTQLVDVRRDLAMLAANSGLDVAGGSLRRTSSRFCLGVEHGDYNGTQLFGVGTDRFLWLAYKPNSRGRVRLFSQAFAHEGVVEFAPGDLPQPRSSALTGRWARFPLGVAHVLARHGLPLRRGFDAVLSSDIPGGGMSRSASLCINLLLTFLAVDGRGAPAPLDLVDLAQQVENDYIGSPCGVLDQTMIVFARAGHGTHYDPATRAVQHIPLGNTPPFALVSLDTGTDRPGLEHSTYKLRRAECEQLVALARPEFGITSLADVRDDDLLARIFARFGTTQPHLCDRLRYIHAAQARFESLLRAWRAGDLTALGAIFRADGLGLRDLYRISGPELETMCDIARTVPGVLGERMLGGGDKGAAGAIAHRDSVSALRDAVATAYPRAYPALAHKAAVHACGIVDGIVDLPGL